MTYSLIGIIETDPLEPLATSQHYDIEENPSDNRSKFSSIYMKTLYKKNFIQNFIYLAMFPVGWDGKFHWKDKEVSLDRRWKVSFQWNFLSFIEKLLLSIPFNGPPLNPSISYRCKKGLQGGTWLGPHCRNWDTCK